MKIEIFENLHEIWRSYTQLLPNKITTDLTHLYWKNKNTSSGMKIRVQHTVICCSCDGPRLRSRTSCCRDNIFCRRVIRVPAADLMTRRQIFYAVDCRSLTPTCVTALYSLHVIIVDCKFAVDVPPTK